ncbi:tumor necrosis factor alpha-induced protein 2-like isoform X2 [Salminus brasiliensis]|uniref:tumor necrosis factor alpha-induced protein 2-like isoform X2 n=1 Tax=Salminus brasiliensis TaxID=930266 RepID=UPI003B830969
MMKTIQLPSLNLRRNGKDEPQSPEDLSSDAVCEAMAEEQPRRKSSGDSADEKRKAKIKIPKKIRITGFMKRSKSKSSPTDTLPVLDFNQNLEQNRLAEAGQQLLAREEQLFNSESADEQVVCTGEEKDQLQKDYETLILRLWMVINDSFNKENQETLKSVVAVILQEEERDRCWEGVAVEKCPVWRPRNCRNTHDMLLRSVVEERIQRANEEESGADDLSTSLKKDVCRMGKRIQNDLLWVVRDLQGCYTPEFDVCNTYTQLYHQAFSMKLQELSQTNIELEDCIYILSWINDYYPKDILQQKEMESHIKSEALGPLLPPKDLKTLEDLYLSHKEAEVRTWLSNALKKEEELWQSDEKPEQIDGYYISNLALDIIHLAEGARKEAITIVGNEDKSQRVLLQLTSFLASYKKSIAEFLKGKHKNGCDVPVMLKANLVSIKQFREYIETSKHLPDDVKAACLSTTAELRDLCHKDILSRVHKELKEQYRKLWTPAWFSESHNIIGDLLKALEDEVQNFTDLKPACREELLSQLHIEVLTEYTRRMLKRKLKLKDKDEQEKAANFLCEDSIRIYTLFIRLGSKEKWLSGVLPKVSEVLRLQDAGTLQLEIVTLARTYPDISERQVLALLQLKTNLSSVDVRNIRSSLTENRNPDSSVPQPSFFCNVPVKRMLI